MNIIKSNSLNLNIEEMAHDLSLMYAKVKFEKDLASPDYTTPTTNEGEIINLVSDYCFAYSTISDLNADYIRELIERYK